jgi:TrmH family RNA methyltransferase
MTDPITSPQNPRLKELRRLARRTHRERGGLFAAEGEDMLAEALRLGATPKAVFYDAEALSRSTPPLDLLPADVEAIPVARPALDAASALGSGSRLIGVWGSSLVDVAVLGSQPAVRGPQDRGHGGPVVYLHEVRDPGNVGAVIRACFALGGAGVVLGPGCADPFGPKAVRAAMGAVFGVPVAQAELPQALAAIGPQARGVAMVPRSGCSLRALGRSGTLVFALGSERSGLPDRITALCSEVAYVPLAGGGAESLNVAMTATLCLYEAAVHTRPA